MERYLFTPGGYRCIDVDGTILHCSEQHEDLFQFIDKDETSLYRLLPEYIHACVDLETMEPTHNNRKVAIDRQIRDILLELHPFCTGEYIDREIMLYFNNKLVDYSMKRSELPEVYEVTEHQYKAIFDSLFPDGFGLDGNFDDENDYQHLTYYTNYRDKLIGNEDYNGLDAPFADLQRSKLLIKDYLYWVLDSQAEPFNELTLPQRLYVYNAYHHPQTLKIAGTEVEYYLGNAEGIRFDGAYMGVRHEIPLTVQLPDGRYMAQAVQGMASNEVYHDMSKEAKALLGGIIREAKGNAVLDEYCAVYGIRDLFTLLFIECQRMYEAKVSIRRCERCGHYFIANKRMYKFCERFIDDDSEQTCRDVGAKENSKKKLNDDPIYYLYNKAYRTHHARIKAGHITKQEFDEWAVEAKRRMNTAAHTPAALEEFAAWLKI